MNLFEVSPPLQTRVIFKKANAMSKKPPSKTVLSRRDFLKLVGTTGGVMVLVGCGISPEKLSLTSTATLTAMPSLTPTPPRVSRINFVDPFFQTRLIATNEECSTPDLVRPTGIVLVDGKVKVILNEEMYCDPLGINVGHDVSHPADRILQLLKNYQIEIPNQVKNQLEDLQYQDELFYQARYSLGSPEELIGTIVKIFPDGSFLVKNITPLPDSFKGPVISPQYFHVFPESIDASIVQKGQELRQKLFDNFKTIGQQIDPPGEYAYEMYSLYLLAKAGKYKELTDQIDFKVNFNFFSQTPLTEIISNVLYGLSPDSKYLSLEEPRNWNYFSGFRIAELLRTAGVGGINPEDAVTESGIFQMNGCAYIPLWNASEPDPLKRSRIIKVYPNKNSEVMYHLPGRTLTFSPLPNDDRMLVASSDAFPLTDPRFQAMYLVDTRSGNYEILNFPVTPKQSEGQPIRKQLYGRSIKFNQDGQYMYTLLYGFSNEGGGLWQIDFTSLDFPKNSSVYNKIAPFDHPRKLFSLDNSLAKNLMRSSIANHQQIANAVITTKEVDNDFSMSATAVSFSIDSLKITSKQKYLIERMPGWNPDPVAFITKDGESLLLLETYPNYETSIIPVEAFPVYLVKYAT